MMNKRKLLLVLGFVAAWGASLSANAGTMVLDGFVDQSPATINLPATQLLMATVNTTGSQGGNDASATTVSIGGSVVAADIAEVCVDYGGVQVACQASPGSLTNISISLGGNQKGGSPFDYRVSLNSSAGGKTILLTVESITNAILTDNIPLPQSTALRNIAGGVTAPILNTSTLQSLAAVTSSTATLGGNITGDGGDPITSRGTVWNTTGAPITENAVPEGGTTIDIPFSHLRDTPPLNAGTLIYFRSYAVNGTGTGYGPDNSFYTEPAASPLSATIDNVGDTGFTINWPPNPAGDGDGALVVVSTNAITALPTDGAEPAFSSVYLTGADIGTNEYVVYRGTGATSVAVTGLTASTLYNVAVFYSAGVGTGETGINYRQTSPATASQTTNTPAVAPTFIIPPTFASVTATTAVLGGTMDSNGGAPVVCGVEWDNDAPGAPYANSQTWDGHPAACEDGVPFVASVTGLPPGDTIYFRAYATNSAGTGFSAENNFPTPATVPTVTVDPAVPLTATTATFGGEVTADGGSPILARGTVWNTTGAPDIVTDLARALAEGGTSVGVPFSHTRIDLPAGTLVYYRAYATNSVGTAYSAVLSFTPSGPPEMVATPPLATSITHNSAVLGGQITSDGGTPILARGTVWNTTGAPTIVDNPLAEGGLTVGVPFSHTRTLPSGTTIFYRSYATNSTGTGYSANDSTFTTETEPTIQATNITFPKVSGRSMRISWTRGNGDGSIVVLRLGTPADPGIQAPTDGNDYAANPDYTLAPELPVNSQNFVVYKGTGNHVLVTGLTLTTNYSVAVYEYAGNGASTDYLTVLPAEATQATTNVPVHNEDNRVNCSDCHSHGSWSPTRAELITACQVCHSALNEASGKLMFENHLTPGRNPDIDVVACGFCHELHTPGGANTTESFNVVTGVTQLNKSFLRANVDKYVSTASPPAYLHTDQPLREAGNPNGDPEALAVTPDRAVEGGLEVTASPTDQQATGYCQVCHTLTKNHRSTNLAGGTPSDQSHDGESNNSGLGTETNCGTCHQHKSNFAGIGGSATCESCHSSEQPTTGAPTRPIITTQFDRLSSHIGGGGPGGSSLAVQEDCMVCHEQGDHQQKTVGVWNVDDGITFYTQTDDTTVVPTTSTGQGEIFAPGCLSCHDTNGASSLPAYAGDPAGQTDMSPFNATSLAPPPIIDSVLWSNASHNRLTASNPTGPFGANPVTCVGDGANGCHASGHGTDSLSLLANAASPNPAVGAAVNLTDFCFNCHDSNGPSSKDIQAQFPASTATDWDGSVNRLYLSANKQHDVLSSDQAVSGATLSCKNCHDPHAVSATEPVLNPDTGASLRTYLLTNSTTYWDGSSNVPFNYWDGTAEMTNVVKPNGAGDPDEMDYIEFCVTCHDGDPPPGVVMPGTVQNIGLMWATNDQHGLPEGNDSSRGLLKAPFPTHANRDGTSNSAMNCSTCHGAHGSGNIYNLRTQVSVAGSPMQIGSSFWDATAIESSTPGQTFGDTSYVFPVNANGQQEMYGWGAWCTFCHEVAHGSNNGLGCSSGHRHGGSNF